MELELELKLIDFGLVEILSGCWTIRAIDFESTNACWRIYLFYSEEV